MSVFIYNLKTFRYYNSIQSPVTDLSNSANFPKLWKKSSYFCSKEMSHFDNWKWILNSGDSQKSKVVQYLYYCTCVNHMGV